MWSYPDVVPVPSKFFARQVCNVIFTWGFLSAACSCLEQPRVVLWLPNRAGVYGVGRFLPNELLNHMTSFPLSGTWSLSMCIHLLRFRIGVLSA